MKKIPLLIPDMPTTDSLLPYLKLIEKNGVYTNYGPLNNKLEQQLLTHFPCEKKLYITTVSSNTLGLELALRALRLPPGALVLIPSFTFPATACAVINAGLTPVFADIDIHSWLLTPETARDALEKFSLAAVMPVTALSSPVDTSQWDKFTTETKIPVIIDAAGAFGNQVASQACTLIFSMHATKALGCGEGGFIISPNKNFIEKIRCASNFGIDPQHKSLLIDIAGTNAKLSEYHAACALSALENWPLQILKRQQRLQWYQQYLNKFSDKIIYQKDNLHFTHSIFSIRLPATNTSIENIMTHLSHAGIETKRWYYPPLHQHPAFDHYPKTNTVPHTQTLSQQLIGLPFYSRLSEEDIAFIAQTLAECL